MRFTFKQALGFSIRFIPKVKGKLKNALTVFVFHDVTDHPSEFTKEYGISVSVKTFSRQINWIKDNFTIIHPSDIIKSTILPKNAAIISFDDGFLGTFDNGLRVLNELGLPAIIFLNMHAIQEQKPIISAVACYLSKYSSEFLDFSKKLGLSSPFHLTLTPSILKSFEYECGVIDYNAVCQYQGPFANINTVREWDERGTVCFGNHLFEHWNASALTVEELEQQYKKNDSALSKFKNKIDLFAFTNGQPGTCFSQRDINILSQLGAIKIFSAAGGINNDISNRLLGRMSLGEADENGNNIWYRIGKTMLKEKLRNY